MRNGCLLLLLAFAGLTTARAQTPAAFALPHGLRLTVRGHAAVITDAKGGVVARNNRLIRQAEDRTDCPADGFRTVVVKGNFFTIEQQNCGGWFFINEYVTFKYVPASGRIQLHKFGQTFIDRRDPNADMPNQVLTEKQFGQLTFGLVDLEALYALPAPTK
ncbi:hypothetical protein [Hymenobacter ruricola]|uniref:Uncharacterized protein n=1 Tax=Hymenobacter ruricola TaxID=2791023 RepID=A0ABS0I6K4_9BACT|nr:hypothetical protein [Hymenobacter ruricola]MBF9222575.1 hypothetical protein [Hymenobacter ruricola]